MDNITGFLSIFMSAISHCQLYSKNHSLIEVLTVRVFSNLNELLKKSGSFEIMIIENDLVVNKNPKRELGLQGMKLIKRLKKQGISHINFLKGITLPELKQFIAHIATTGQKIISSPHVKIGIVDLHIEELQIARDSDIKENLSHFTSEEIEKVKEEYNRISPFKKLHLAGLEEIVANFALTLQKEVNILKLLSPVKSYGEYDFTHATNVSILTIFQAQSLGIRDEFHSDIGLAALFHDVGKCCIPKEILEKEDSLEAKEMKVMDLHPLYGTQYLAKIKGLTHLAPIVAYEHHLRYDGYGYSNNKKNGMKQHICSQMTAISDSFDTLRNTGSYKKALDIKDTLVTMKTKDPGLFNPFLVDSFIRSIHLALSQ